MWQCDNHPDQCAGNDACIFRDYINDVTTTSAIYSLVVQSIHRLLAVLFTNNIRLQKYQLRIILCIIQWVIAFLYPLYYIYLYPQLQYDPVSYVCVISRNSGVFITIYAAVIDAVLPFTIIVGIYVRLYIYVRRLRRDSAILLTTKREVRMALRMFFLLGMLAIGSIPGTILQSMQSPPDYQMRIYYFTVTIISFCCLICVFTFTPQLKQWLIERKNNIKHRVHPQVNPAIARARNRY